MARGTKILDLPLAQLRENLKIPTGGFGDFAVDIAMLREFFKVPHGIFQTTSPDIFIEDGIFQELRLQNDGVLRSNIGIGQYILIYCPQGYNNLDYSSFDVCNQFDYDRLAENFILLVNMDGRKLLFGCKSQVVIPT